VATEPAEIVRSAPPALLEAAARLPTPALVYDLDGIRHTVSVLRRELAGIRDLTLCFALKANRCPAVLAALAADGLGGDAASTREWAAARQAGMAPIFATSPAFAAGELEALAGAGVLVDLDSLTQIEAWSERLPGRRDIGLRLAVTMSAVEADDAPGAAGQGRLSRFGVHPADPALHRLLEERGLSVRRLHIHAGEYEHAGRAARLFEVIETCLPFFPEVELVNLGGGLTRLYADRGQASAAWDALRAMLDRVGRPLRVVLEPGMLVTALSGYLVAQVVAVQERPGGQRVVTLDASAWNVMSWSAPRVMHCEPARSGPARSHLVGGATCYERDVFVRDLEHPALQPGDRLVIRGAGAYSSSMARNTHDLPIPDEWVYDGGACRPGGAR
jgi:diaminopimelate decarboxylase